MTSFKEMIIRRPRVSTLPELVLQGKWLEPLGFPAGQLVHLHFHEGCLTLSTQTTPLYLHHVATLTVTHQLRRGHPRTCLRLDGFLLKRCDFHAGDRLGLSLRPNQIQAVKMVNFTTDENIGNLTQSF